MLDLIKTVIDNANLETVTDYIKQSWVIKNHFIIEWGYFHELKKKEGFNIFWPSLKSYSRFYIPNSMLILSY